MVIVRSDDTPEIPTEDWPEDKRELYANRLAIEAKKSFTYDVLGALNKLDRIKEEKLYKFTKYKTWNRFCKRNFINLEAVEVFRQGSAIIMDTGYAGKISGEQATAAMGPHGFGPGRGNKRDSNGNSFNGGNNAKYTKARLARDRPDLLVKVEAGELSANAAAIEVGWRKRMLQVPADDLAAALSKINSHYGTEYQ